MDELAGQLHGGALAAVDDLGRRAELLGVDHAVVDGGEGAAVLGAARLGVRAAGAAPVHGAHPVERAFPGRAPRGRPSRAHERAEDARERRPHRGQGSCPVAIAPLDEPPTQVVNGGGGIRTSDEAVGCRTCSSTGRSGCECTATRLSDWPAGASGSASSSRGHSLRGAAAALGCRQSTSRRCVCRSPTGFLSTCATAAGGVPAVLCGVSRAVSRPAERTLGLRGQVVEACSPADPRPRRTVAPARERSQRSPQVSPRR
jgi:hypothetical protein